MSTEDVNQLRPLLWPREWPAEMIPVISGSEFGCVVMAEPAPGVAAAAAQAGVRVIPINGENVMRLRA